MSKIQNDISTIDFKNFTPEMMDLIKNTEKKISNLSKKLLNIAKEYNTENPELKKLSQHLNKSLNALKDKSISLKEGVWALPTNEKEIEKGKEYIEKLKKFKDEIYHIFGDDEVFNGLDAALTRMKELVKIAPTSPEWKAYKRTPDK
jgi:DNA repair exonuclease SbcCD ATPase subunit